MHRVGFRPLAPPAMPIELARAGSMLGKGAVGNSAAHRSGSSVETPGPLGQFAQLIAGKIHDVSAMQTTAEHLVHQQLSGQNITQAEVLTAVQKADLALRTMMQLRNQLLEAYRELQQIQV